MILSRFAVRLSLTQKVSLFQFAALTFVNYFKYTQNATWLREVSYPLLRAVAAWWSCWLVKVPASDGGYTYNDLTDCTYENW